MRHLVLILALCLFGLPVAAAPLTVRTGEHTDFTRVVISIPSSAEWAVGRTEDGYAVRIPVEDGYNLRGFYNLIPRDRIADVAQEAATGELRMTVACECYADAYEFGSGFLVVDIKDGQPAPNAPFEVAFPEPEEQITPPASPLRQDTRIATRIIPLLTPPLNEETDLIFSEREDREIAVSEPLQPNSVTQNTGPDISAITDEIAENIGLALTEGLLDGELQSAALSTRGEPNNLLAEVLDLPGVSARTSIDPQAVPASATLKETQSGAVCLPDRFFDLSSWTGDGPFYAERGARRSALFDVRDNPDTEAIEKLAKFYVAYGFGSEARQIMALDAGNSRERLYLNAVSHLVEGSAVDPGLFASQVSCPSNVALWALLASEQLPLDASVDNIAIVQAFKRLPSVVQPMIGPDLANRLLEIGANETALQILQPGRMPAAIDPVRSPAEAALLDALGEDDVAFETLARAARGGPRPSPDTLIQFFEAATARNAPLLEEDFVLANALRFENAGTETAYSLAVAQFQAYLATEAFGDARSLLEEVDEAQAISEIQPLHDEWLDAVTSNANDGAFLRLVWNHNPARNADDVMRRAAERLGSLGFIDRANAISPKALDETIFDELEKENVPSVRSGATMTAGNLGDLPSRATEARTITSSAGASQQTTLPGEEPTLARSRALLQTAAQSREVLNAFLNDSLSEF